jgi:hypothetical protein
MPATSESLQLCSVVRFVKNFACACRKFHFNPAGDESPIMPRTSQGSPEMRTANFCAECGERLALKGWRGRLGRRLCDRCKQRLGAFASFRTLIGVALIAVAAFAIGKYSRPAPPPLVIQRAANSPLYQSPAESSANAQPLRAATSQSNQAAASVSNEEGYICGARTKKGAPCQRRVHAPGERCFQHKGLPAMVALDRLIVKPKP